MIISNATASAKAVSLTKVASAQSTADRSVLVTVLDKDGTPRRDLTVADFIVKEDGQRREVTHAELTTEPLAVALLIDLSKHVDMTAYPVRDVRLGLANLTKVILADNPQSQISLMDFAGAAVKTVDYTSNGDLLLAAINRLFASTSSFVVFHEALTATAKDLQKSKTARRAIVVVGFDAVDWSSTSQPRDVEIEVLKSGAAFWGVAVGKSQDQNRDALFESLPPRTGGRRVTMGTATGLPQALEQVGRALTSQYEITFNHAAESQPASIDVSTKRGDTVLRSLLVR
jgi:hypothetical protein